MPNKWIALDIIKKVHIKTLEFSLNYQQYEVDISATYFFPFSLVIFIIVTHRLLNILNNWYVLKELMCQEKWKNKNIT